MILSILRVRNGITKILSCDCTAENTYWLSFEKVSETGCPVSFTCAGVAEFTVFGEAAKR